MKTWKLAYKVMCFNCGIVIFIGMLCAFANNADGFGLVFGIVCLAGGLIDLLLGLIIYFTASKDWGKGFLNSAGILLLLSGISCGTGLANLNLR